MACDFKVRGIELHSLYAWDFQWVKKTLDFIKDNGMNTLVLHRNDFLDLIIYPGKYFGCTESKNYETKYDRYNDIYRSLYKYTPTRRSGPVQRRAFFKRVLHEANVRGIEVYVENKELFFPEIILELNPELVNNGAICANNPFWWEFTKVKYKEFLSEFPGVAGIITSPGTGESRVSINSNRCTCELCQKATKGEWYKNLLYAMYDTIHAAGKKLIIRDFVFDPKAQEEIAAVMEKMPEDVVISLKNTPHDYYPTFPENPRIGQVGNHEQWIEFDAMGQYFGWGIGIADIMEDYRRRLKSAREKGATGAIFRTDWESLDGHSSFCTPNLINHYSAAALSRDTDTPAQDIYLKYLEVEGWFRENASKAEKEEAAAWFGSISSKTWDITARTPYVDDCVFSDSSLTPLGLGHAYWLAEEKNSLRDWDTSKWEVLYPTEENVRRSLKEKDDALEAIDALYSNCAQACPAAIRQEKYKNMCDSLLVNKTYVKFYRAATYAVVLTRYILETKENRSTSFYREMEQRLRESLEYLVVLKEEMEVFYKETSYSPHTIYTIMDPDRLGALYRNLTACLEKGGFKVSAK